MPDDPRIAIWVTSTGRPYVKTCLPSFLDQCTYPNMDLLITEKCPENDCGTWRFFESLDFPRKKLFNVKDLDLSQTLYLLLENSPDYYLNIEDDCLYLADPADFFRDAIGLIERVPGIGMVRASCHCPPYLDLLAGRFHVEPTDTGPVVFGLGLASAQHFTSAKKIRAVPGLWQRGDYRKLDMAGPMYRHGLFGATMLKYWGFSVHAGLQTMDGVMTESNRFEQQEREVIVQNRMYGLRAESTLYSGSMNESQRRAFMYPLFLAGVPPLVAGHIPVSAQERVGPSIAMAIC